ITGSLRPIRSWVPFKLKLADWIKRIPTSVMHLISIPKTILSMECQKAHNRLGRIYLEQHKLEQADYHLRQSLTLGRRIDDKDGMVNNLLQFGRLFSLEKEYELADMHFKLALSRANEMNLKNY